MYIPAVFRERVRLTTLLEDAHLFEGILNRGLLAKAQSVLRDRTRPMAKSEKQTQETCFLGHNPLKTRLVSFQGFGNGHYVHIEQDRR